MTSQIILSKEWAKAVEDIDGAVAKRVLSFQAKLIENPDQPGLNVKMLQGKRDKRIRTARVTDGWRAVLVAVPKTQAFILLTVLPHDQGNDAGANFEVNVNKLTGALELINAGSLEDLGASLAADIPVHEQQAPIINASHDDLVTLGILEKAAVLAVRMTDRESFELLCNLLPFVQGRTLRLLAQDKTAEEVLEILDSEGLLLDRPEEIDPDDLMAAVDRPTSRPQFAKVDSPELQAAIDGSLEDWRVWLHPLQEWAAYHDGWNGPFRLTGGAGTGKTVCAIHRAAYLAERLQAEGDHADHQILFATFTKNLAEELKRSLRALASDDITDTVHVINLDALAHEILRHRGLFGPGHRLVPDDDPIIWATWESAITRTEVRDWSPDFLNSEWVDVKLAHAIEDRSEYFEVPRTGRRVPLHRKQRARVWLVLKEFERQLAQKSAMTHIQMIALAARLAKADPGLLYRHAVVDEAQDLHPAHWRLIRALVPEGKDDIFLVGDAHQRIYGNRIVLSHCGINTVGRSRRLTVNYRTSAEILAWSLDVMRGADIDDMEGADDSLVGARSEFHGPDPELLWVDTHEQEDERLAKQLRLWLSEGYDTNDIAVFARRNDDVKTLRDSLLSSEIPAQVVGRSTTAKPGHVQVMSLHRAKGLEFPAVAMARLGADDHEWFYVDSGTGEDKPKAVPIERALLYVGATRARERLALLASGRPSRLVARLRD